MRYFVDTGPSERGGMPRGGRLEACKHQGASSRARHGPLCRLAIVYRGRGSAPISSSRHRSRTLPPLVSLIHTFGGPYGSLLGVNGACQMKVNQMSLALALWPKGMQPWGVDLESIIAGYFRLEKTFSRHARADIRPICYSRLEPCMCDVNLRGFRPLLTFSVATPRPLTTCTPCPAELELTVAN